MKEIPTDIRRFVDDHFGDYHYKGAVAAAILAERERCWSIMRELVEHSHPPVGIDTEYLRKKHEEAVAKALAFLGIERP